MRSITSSALICAIAIIGTPCFGVDSPPAPSQSATDGTGAQDGAYDVAPDNLDSLLDLADQDLSRLTEIQVTKSTGVAPSLDTVVTTVERKESTVGRTPSAVFVITNEMIRRSGARSIPEVLRMAPGVQVARIDGNKWALSIRGFNSRFSNKLLVQIDGRSIYTPLYGGVLWDVQDVLLEDVERIEVVRGPGGTVWGANAVNGVINIITKSARDTQGVFLESGGGTERAFASARQGGALGDNGAYRIYGKWLERDRQFAPIGRAHDDWRQGRGGFRADWDLSPQDHVTLQGELYDSIAGGSGVFASPMAPFFTFDNTDMELSGGNLLGRLRHDVSDDSNWQVQFYYDHSDIRFQQGPSYYRDTLDLDFQHSFQLTADHQIVWGAGYRWNRDKAGTIPFFFSLVPQTREYDRVGAFVQDTMTLLDDELYFTIGAKASYNDYTRFEFQPSARVLWTPTEKHSIWASVSRAVRTTSRAESDGRIVRPAMVVPNLPPLYPVVTPGASSNAENLLAYEFGIRHQPEPWFSWDLALFYNDYDDLIAGGPPGAPSPAPEGLIVPVSLTNLGAGQTYGFELATNLELTDWWRLYGNYSFFRMNLNNVASSGQPGDAPRNQVYLQSSFDLPRDWDVDLIWRYVDVLPNQRIPSYLTMDIRLGWSPRDWFEFYVAGRNLLDQEHPEAGNDAFAGTLATEVQREVFGGVSLRY